MNLIEKKLIYIIVIKMAMTTTATETMTTGTMRNQVLTKTGNIGYELVYSEATMEKPEYYNVTVEDVTSLQTPTNYIGKVRGVDTEKWEKRNQHNQLRLLRERMDTLETENNELKTLLGRMFMASCEEGCCGDESKMSDM